MRKYYLIALFTFLAIHCKKDDIVINNPPPPPEVKIPTLTTYNVSDKRENGYSLLLNSKFFTNWEAQALFISSANRSDWLFRPRAVWSFERNWRMVVGADIFNGPAMGMFGRYDQQDRVYSEVRYSF